MTNIIITDEELELVTGAGETGATVGGVIGAGIGSSQVCPIGPQAGGAIGSAIGSKVEDIVSGASIVIANAIYRL